MSYVYSLTTKLKPAQWKLRREFTNCLLPFLNADTFASKVAAIQDQYADSSIGNVTGSNAVNVFLGIGIAWSLAAIYHAANNSRFKVEAGSLGFSVTVFCVFAVICFALLIIRRTKRVGGELGGPLKYKIPTTCIFFSLWIAYVLLSSMEAYCYISWWAL